MHNKYPTKFKLRIFLLRDIKPRPRSSKIDSAAMLSILTNRERVIPVIRERTRTTD